MLFKFIGDIHSDKNRIKDLKPYTIQLGEFYLFDYQELQGLIKTGPVFFIDGNHENLLQLNLDAPRPYRVVNNLFHIPRGFVSDGTMFLGGADSIDKPLRTPGLDWFPEETISQAQFEKIMSLNHKIEVMVTHDCPTWIFPQYPYHCATSRAMDAIFDHFKPKVWIFGHHHQTVRRMANGCQFFGMNMNEVLEMDVPVKKEDFLL